MSVRQCKLCCQEIKKFTVAKIGQGLYFTLGSCFHCLHFLMSTVLIAHLLALQNPMGILAGINVSVNTEIKVMVIVTSH